MGLICDDIGFVLDCDVSSGFQSGIQLRSGTNLVGAVVGNLTQ
jgi:hypothetical protein